MKQDFLDICLQYHPEKCAQTNNTQLTMCEPKFLLRIKLKVNVHCYADSYATRRSANNILTSEPVFRMNFAKLQLGGTGNLVRSWQTVLQPNQLNHRRWYFFRLARFESPYREQLSEGFKWWVPVLTKCYREYIGLIGLNNSEHHLWMRQSTDAGRLYTEAERRTHWHWSAHALAKHSYRKQQYFSYNRYSLG
jgi:hypothetical protein